MQSIFLTRLIIVATMLLILGVISCSKENLNLNNLDETIIVRHKNADMPAYIHGNGSEKVFLIVLHDGPGGNGLKYRVNTIRTEIEKNNAVVYFDQRGSGNSQGNYSDKEVSLDIMAEDVLALAKIIKSKYGNDSKLFLMGHTWGGAMGTAVLLKNQNHFSGWIDVDGSHDLKGEYNGNKISLKKIANEQITLNNNVDYWTSILNLVNNVNPIYDIQDFYSLNRAAHEAEIILAEDNIINASKFDFGIGTSSYNKLTALRNDSKIQSIFLNKNRVYETVSFTDKLSEITIPALVLWGKYDPIVPSSKAQEAFDNLGSIDKEIFVFEKSAHSPFLSEPTLFANKVIGFINKHK